MPTITLSDETYARLADLARREGLALPDPLPEPDGAANAYLRMAECTIVEEHATPEVIAERLRRLEALTKFIRERPDFHPPAFVDDSREAIYEGCGE